MNFLYISESQHPILGGASKCIYTLFAALVKKGHTCYTLGYNVIENILELQGITVIHTTNLQSTFTRFLQEGIDVVVTQLQGIEWVVDLCSKYKIPVILRVPSFEGICQDVNKMRTCNLICLKGQQCTSKGILFKTFRSSLVTTCSRFTTNIVQSMYGIRCTTIYPFIDEQEYLVPNTGNCITMIQGTEPKGLDIFLSIVNKLPNYNYLIVGQLRDNTKLSPNIIHISPTEDMKSIWQQTKILIVPSLVQETFGRVAVEAQINGIPVLASNIGGLPEAVCPVFCYKPNTLDPWTSEIERLMEDSTYYNIRSMQVKEHVEKFKLEDQVSKFLQLVGKIKYKDIQIIDPDIKISILTSSYKSGTFLKDYFEMLKSQIYTNFEIILTLNDPTLEEEVIVAEYTKYFDITVLRVPLEPVTDTYNSAFQLATGDLLLAAAVDDLLREDALQRYVVAYKSNPDISVIYCDHIRKNVKGETTKGPSSDFNFDLLKQLFYLGPHVVITKDIINDGHLLDIDYLYACDYEYYLRLASKGYKFLRIPIVLSTYLEHDDAITYRYRQEQIDTTNRIQGEYK